MEKSALYRILPRLTAPAIVGACCAALVIAFAIAPPPADAATSSKPHRPAIAKASISGKAKAYTVKVKVKKAKVGKRWGAVVRIQSKGMRTRTAKVGKKRTVKVKKVRAKAGAKVKVSVRAWHKARGKRKAWSKRSKTLRLTAPSATAAIGVTAAAPDAPSEPSAPDTSHFTITIAAVPGATGYQVRYADNPSFDGATVVDVESAGKVTLEGIEGTVNYISARSVFGSGDDAAAYSAWSDTVTANLTAHEHSYTEPVYETTHHAAQTSTYYECMACGYQTTDKDEMDAHAYDEGHNPENPYYCTNYRAFYRTVTRTVPAYDVKELVGHRCGVCNTIAACSDAHGHSYTEPVYATLHYDAVEIDYCQCKCGYKVASEGAMTEHCIQHIDDGHQDLASYSIFWETLPAYDETILVGHACPECGDVTLS